LKDFVVAALYTDVHPQYREVQNKRFKSISLPLYVVLGPDGQERSRLAGRISLDQFLEFLKKGQEHASAPPPDAETKHASSN
jgi:thiol:disulfide interchange protein